MINGDERCRIYNRTQYDVGVRLTNGLEFNIIPGSFIIATVNDVLAIESMCPNTKYFTSKKLVATDMTGKEMPLEDMGLWTPVGYNGTHITDDEINASLKLPVKKLEQWLEDITDETELHAIYAVASSMTDLPMSKIKILRAKMPNKDWFDDLSDN